LGPESESGVQKFSNPGVGVSVPQKNEDSTSLCNTEKYFGGHCKDPEKDGNQTTPGTEM